MRSMEEYKINNTFTIFQMIKVSKTKIIICKNYTKKYTRAKKNAQVNDCT